MRENLHAICLHAKCTGFILGLNKQTNKIGDRQGMALCLMQRAHQDQKGYLHINLGHVIVIKITANQTVYRTLNVL